MRKAALLFFLFSLVLTTAAAKCPEGWTCPGEDSNSNNHCPTCGGPPVIPNIIPEEPIRPENTNYTHPEYIMYADELHSIIESNAKDYIIIDARPSDKYNVSHIPNAINIPWYELKDLSKAAEILGNHGISNDVRVVVYSDSCSECGGMGVAAYVFWLLKYLGHKDVSLLDGGIEAWSKLYNTTSKPLMLAPKKFNTSVKQELFADVNWVEKHLNDPNVQIIDARTKEEYDSGHIPNAINIGYNSLMRRENRLKGADVLNYLFTGKGIDKNKEILVYCKSGLRSSYMFFALSTMGYKVRNYVGGWEDWIKYHPTAKLEISINLSAKKVYQGQPVEVYARVRYDLPLKASFCPSCGSDLVNIPAMISKPKDYDVKAYVKDGDSIKAIAVLQDNDRDGIFTGTIQTFALSPGNYTVEVVAKKDGLKATAKTTLSIVIDNIPPKIENVSVMPKTVHFGQRIKIIATIVDVSHVKAHAIIKNKNGEVGRVYLANRGGKYIGYWYAIVDEGDYTIDIFATDSNNNNAKLENAAKIHVSGMNKLSSYKSYNVGGILLDISDRHTLFL